MNDRLVLLVGASGSGKTTIAKTLDAIGYNVIQSYTTRKPREPDEWGHIFVDEESLNYKLGYYTKDIIAYFEGYGYKYWATKEQYQGKETSIYVIDPTGAEEVKSKVDDAEVITIFLMADWDTRKKRMLQDETRRHTLINDRLRADTKIFHVCKCDYVVDANRDVEKVLEDILAIIDET